MKFGLHPASLILAWAACATLVSRLSGRMLALALLALLAAALLRARRRLLRLVRRARFLLLTLFLVFGWATPGQYLLPSAGMLSPSLEGLAFAAAHVGIIVAMLAMVAMLLDVLAPPALAAGCATLFGRMLGRRGADDRLLARLCLVMQYVEGPAVHWRDWLHADQAPQAGAPLQVPAPVWRRRDSLLCAAALVPAGIAVGLL
ncbi:MAG: hypothetical protein JNJ60_00270 [Rhodocyclaceae bacterium]|nr:hypothetical protein [Rhodocyclaceae bacterium]